MPTSQLTDITPETAANLFGGTKKNPIGITEAEAVRAAIAAVEASLHNADTTTTETPVTAALYGGVRESVFPTVPFEVRFANLQNGISQLAAAGIRSM